LILASPVVDITEHYIYARSAAGSLHQFTAVYRLTLRYTLHWSSCDCGNKIQRTREGKTTSMAAMMRGVRMPAAAAGKTKLRKPYTITRPRERWTDEEHDRFLHALHM
jgi:hypothetical protein